MAENNASSGLQHTLFHCAGVVMELEDHVIPSLEYIEFEELGVPEVHPIATNRLKLGDHARDCQL
jgi:hypothetical protein